MTRDARSKYEVLTLPPVGSGSGDLDARDRALLALISCNRAMLDATGSGTGLPASCRAIRDGGGYRGAWLALLDENDKLVVGDCSRISATDPRPQLTDLLGHELASVAVEQARPILGRGTPAVLGLPLSTGGKPVGALVIVDDDARAFAVPAVAVLNEIAAGVATAIEARRVRAKLSESLETVDAIIRATPLAVITLDLEGTVLTWNPAAERIFGWTAAEVVGRFVPYIGAHETESFLANHRGAIEGSGLRSVPLLRRRKDGSEIEITLHTAAIRDSAGHPRAILGVIEDATHVVSLERKLRRAQKLEALGTLAGGIAHDFNNILAAILGYADLVQLDLPSDSRSYAQVGEILIAARRARDLIKRILAFSKQTAGDPQPLKLNGVVEDAVKLLRASFPATIAVETRLDPNSHVVMADPVQIHQIILNLGNNAEYAMRGRDGKLTVTLANVTLDVHQVATSPELHVGDYVCLSITDTGEGMDQATVDRLFEPYFTTKPVGEGSGLGLPMVHGIVSAFRGTISVTSTPGTGSTFNIFLPRHIEVAAATEAAPASLGVRRGHIVVVDDEVQVLRLLREMLEALGYRTTACNNGGDALAQVKRDPAGVDLVITDLTMPNMNGRQLAEAIAGLRPQLPVVLTTGYGQSVDTDEPMPNNIRQIVAKPVALRDLAGACELALAATAEARKES